MSKRNYTPKSALQDKGLVGPYVQEKFNGGMIKDSSPLEIPANATVELTNVIPSDEKAMGRYGSRLFGSAQLPVGFSKIDASIYHPILNRFFVLVSSLSFPYESKLYHISASMDAVDGWKELTILGGESFHNSYSHFELEGNDLWLINAGGLFRVVTDNRGVDEYIVLKANMDGLDPTSKVSDNKLESSNTSKYYYIVTHSILENSFYGQTRKDDGVRVLYESPPVFPDTNNNDYAEYDSIVPAGWYNAREASDPILTTDIDVWRGYGNDEVFSFYIYETIIDSTVTFTAAIEVNPDFSNVESYQDILDAINDAIEESVKYFKFRYNTRNDGTVHVNYSSSDRRFTLDLKSSTISNALGFPVVNPDQSIDDGPKITINTSENDKPFTHFSIYRTADVSLINRYNNGEEVDLSDGRITNDENSFVWVNDIPRGKIVPYNVEAYAAMINHNGTGTWVTSDRISVNDSGETIYAVDGTTDRTIIRTTYDDSGEESFLVSNTITDMDGTVGNIGCSIVETATQTSGVVVSTAAFVSAAVVGDYITWSDGSFSLVESIDSSTQLTTADKSTRSSQYAGVLNFDVTNRERVYHDTRTDDELKSGIGYESLLTRLMKPLPNCNVGKFVNGYFIGTNKGGNVISYSQTANSYHVGIHNPLIQVNRFINDGIHSITEINRIAIIRCKNKTYIMNPQQGQSSSDPRIPEAVFILETPQLIDGSIGTSNEVSVAQMGTGREIVYTSEPALRVFDGQQYSDNLAQGKIQESDLQRFTGPVTVDYDPIHGITLWGEQ